MSDTVSTVSPPISHEVMGPDAMILPPRSRIFSVLHSSISGDGKRIAHGTEFNSPHTPQKGPWGKVPDTFLPATSGWVFLS